MNAHTRRRQSFEVALDDGTPIVLRPMRAEDRGRIRRGLRWLSPESRYNRFFTPLPRMSDAQARYLAEADQVNHVAWAALDPAAPELPGVGIGRFVRLGAEPTVAEAAVVVIDAYQGRGLGNALLALLYQCARRRGVRTLRSVLLPERRRLVEKLLALGAAGRVRDGVLELDLPVHLDDGALPRTPAAERLRRDLARLRAARVQARRERLGFADGRTGGTHA